jgi:hypothetical protein
MRDADNDDFDKDFDNDDDSGRVLFDRSLSEVDGVVVVIVASTTTDLCLEQR